MALLTPGVVTELALLLVVALAGVYVYFRHCYRYWNKRKVRHTNPSFPFGDFQGIGRSRSMPQIINGIYAKFKNEKIVGYWSFSKPFLLVRDPEIIKTVLVKDFSHFHDRGIEIDTKVEPLAGHLFLMKGQEWRNLRIKLAPTFTSGKMKMMFPTMISVGEVLKKVVDREVGNSGAVLEVKDYLARFTTDVIASCAFGLDVNSLENPESEFRVVSKRLLNPSTKQFFFQQIAFVMPLVAKLFKLNLFPRDVTEFFLSAVKDTISSREENNIQRNDFMQLLIQLKNKGYIEDVSTKDNEEHSGPLQNFTVEQATAQAFVFFFAGFETSSATMQFTLYELALQTDIQKKLHEEIDAALAKAGGLLTYECIQGMEYLDKVVSETLRKYPVAPILARQCNKNLTVPGTDISFQKGDSLLISVAGIHHDPAHYPNPEKFDPERFSVEEKQKRNHYVYLPFGEGPRICIGNRFGLMQTKVGLVTLLSSFLVEVSAKTPIPIKLDPKVNLMVVKGGMHLNVRRRPKRS